jgi:hypothetical protein
LGSVSERDRNLPAISNADIGRDAMRSYKSTLLAGALLVSSAQIGKIAAQEVELTWTLAQSYKVGDSIRPAFNVLLDGDPPPMQAFTFECCTIASACDIEIAGPSEDHFYHVDLTFTITAQTLSLAGGNFTFDVPGQWQISIYTECTWVANYMNPPPLPPTVRKIPPGNPEARKPYKSVFINVTP